MAERPDQLSGPSRVIGSNEADDALLARYRKGDRAAFAELVVRYQRPLYNAALWIVRKPEDASDVTQIVFLRVAERLGMRRDRIIDYQGFASAVYLAA